MTQCGTSRIRGQCGGGTGQNWWLVDSSQYLMRAAHILERTPSFTFWSRTSSIAARVSFCRAVGVTFRRLARSCRNSIQYLFCPLTGGVAVAVATGVMVAVAVAVGVVLAVAVDVALAVAVATGVLAVAVGVVLAAAVATGVMTAVAVAVVMVLTVAVAIGLVLTTVAVEAELVLTVAVAVGVSVILWALVVWEWAKIPTKRAPDSKRVLPPISMRRFMMF